MLERAAYLLRYRQYVPAEIYVSDDLGLAYVSIPKVACTSIQSTLVRSARDVRMCRRLPARGRRHITFTFIRNPFERLVSCYRDKVLRFQSHTGHYHFDTRYSRILIRGLFGAEFRADMSFADFVELVVRIPDWLADAHFKSQSAILAASGCRFPAFVGRFENLSGDWAELSRAHGLGPLPHQNAGGGCDTWANYYADLNTVDVVAARYARDLEGLGYENAYEELRGRTAHQYLPR